MVQKIEYGNLKKFDYGFTFTNGILKVNLNFVRDRVGSDNTLHRVWIQEISPTREEIRIVPLKTNDSIINNITKTQFTNLKSLVKEFAYYKTSILNIINSFDNVFLTNWISPKKHIVPIP